jgi:ribosome-associated protein
LTTKQRALALAEALADRKGADIRVLDLGGVCSFTDFFVIATGTSDRHLRALADAVSERARELGERVGREGERSLRWALIDLGDIVVHLFSPDARAFYALERLWGDADSVPLQAVAGAGA